MTILQGLQREVEITRQQAAAELLARRKASSSLLDFIVYNNLDYTVKWFNQYVCEQLDKFERGEITKLMIFMPPQTGKSTISSINYPAYRLGRNPDVKIGVISYAAERAYDLNRKCQQIIDTKFYRNIFPNTTLNSSNVVSDAKGGKLRNSEIFETVEGTGFFKSVGVGGALTGFTIDEGIIDDPFKDREQANSKRFRDKVWDWYTDVFKTRLHNHSKELMLFTRWHEDDLAGRILSDSDISKGWVVISLPALKEDNKNTYDPREIGDALFPERHSKERMEEIRVNSPRTFASLYQQRPAPAEGDQIKKAWFGKIQFSELMQMIRNRHFENDIFADTAYTEKTKNDPSGLFTAVYFDNKMYILNSETMYKGLPDLVTYTKSYADLHKVKQGNIAIRIEPKASGISYQQTLTKEGYNAVLLPAPITDKIARVEDVTPFLEAGRCILVEGPWNDHFLTEVGSFPNATHDEQVDNLTNAIKHYDKVKIKRFL